MRPNPFDEFPKKDHMSLPYNPDPEAGPGPEAYSEWEVEEWLEKWEPILSEWGTALDEVQDTDPMSVEATLLRWRWRALHSERKLEAVRTHLADRIEELRPATDYECETLKMELEVTLKILGVRGSTPTARSQE